MGQVSTYPMAKGKTMKLHDTEILATFADTLPAWTYDRDRNALYRQIELSDFVDAFGLMTRIAIIAERRGHHPEWSNVYNRIEIWLTTHDEEGVTNRDVELAGDIDRLAQRY